MSLNLANHIQSDPYLRERLEPKPGDHSYLHLSDLRLALGTVATDQRLLVLDYGCGGSPYRSLFPNADYRRADFLQGPDDILDYRLDEKSIVTEKDGTFDFILSTQVLEHVDSPERYLRECFRLLKSGGQLYLTTHGSYPDHACPYDFYRWTLDGLVRDLQAVGFQTIRTEKMTTGPRALFQQLDYQFRTLFAPRRTLFGLFLAGVRFIYARLQPWLHRMCDRYFQPNRVVTQEHTAHVVYHVVGCLVKKL